MPGPDNAILGDEYGIDLPESQIDQKEITEEQRKGKYSRSAEFKAFRERMEKVIEAYQLYLPSGVAVREADAMTDQELGRRWRAATIIIAEIRAVLDEYDNAAETAKQTSK